MDRQRGLKRELQQLPKPKEKANGQPVQVRPQGMAGTSPAQGQGRLRGRLELQGEKDRLSVLVVRSSRTSSPKTPSLCPCRCTNASHQHQAGGWNALELPSHGNCCAAGTYLPPPIKIPTEPPRRAMGPSLCSRVAVPCSGSLASRRQGSSWLPGHCQIWCSARKTAWASCGGMEEFPVALTGTKWPNPTASHHQGERL